MFSDDVVRQLVILSLFIPYARVIMRLKLCCNAPYSPFWTTTRPRGYKTFFVLNSVEHEILNAHKYKIINKFSFL